MKGMTEYFMNVEPYELDVSGHGLGLSEGDLLVPRCQQCEHWNPLTARLCLLCGSAELRWEAPSGRGTVRLLRPANSLPGDLRDAFVDLIEGPIVLGCVRWDDYRAADAEAVFRFAGRVERARPLFVPAAGYSRSA